MEVELDPTRPSKRLAHISDLHIGRSLRHDAAALAIRNRLEQLNIDHVLVTGDIANGGRFSEYAHFKKIFADFFDAGKITAIPGNHDRLGDEVAIEMLGNKRVVVVNRPGLHIVAVDSTGSHNRYRMLSHGKIDRQVITEVENAVQAAAIGDAVVVALHHHLIPQPEELWLEKLARFFRTPIAKELALSQQLIHRLIGKADLVLHGHRHVPLQTTINDGVRPLGIYNAGSSTHLKNFRIFDLAGGRLNKEGQWADDIEPIKI